MKIKINDLKKAYNNALDAENKLSVLLQELSVIASECYGEELTANICNGTEIEFRSNNENHLYIRLEDIIYKMKNK